MKHAVERLFELAERQPDAQILATHGRTYSYAQFVARAAGVLAALRAAGFARGDRVATLLEEYDSFFATTFAVWMGGGVVVPLNTSLPQSDIEWLIAKSRPRLVAVPATDTAVARGRRDARRRRRADPGRRAGRGFDVIGADELAMIMFTSGTTGVPKGVCQHLTAITANASHVSDVLGLAADDRIFINTPPYFTSGICHFLTLMSHGGGVTGQLGFFFGENLLAEMDELGCTRLRRRPRAPGARGRAARRGAGPGPPALLGQLRRPPAGQDDRQDAPCTARRAPVQHVRTHRGLGTPLRVAARRARPARGLGRRADRRHDASRRGA